MLRKTDGLHDQNRWVTAVSVLGVGLEDSSSPPSRPPDDNTIIAREDSGQVGQVQPGAAV